MLMERLADNGKRYYSSNEIDGNPYNYLLDAKFEIFRDTQCLLDI
jgi:hypothetical protein